MEKSIRLKVRKDLDPRQQLTVIKLKGSLISRGYTEIIHIQDQDEEFHINTFETEPERRNEVQKYIAAFLALEDLSEAVRPLL
ncbi:MAG: hypothetical protein J7574_20295 [Flavobacterium sp.]|uniref:hypothetical protein n=1 Tax=Flavobacterium sp. TaxID=239 RepID=UPI001B299503|nr:hypothetical protein [Flavobacterium sp.]MBO9586514.1 hypothetical protein [Flavobacterium sp.]